MKSVKYRDLEIGGVARLYLAEWAEASWGSRFLVASELDAYRVAYAYRYYRYSRHGVNIKYIEKPGWNWQVTIFNAEGQRQGLAGARPILLPPENPKNLGIWESQGWAGDDLEDCLRAVYDNRG